MPRLKLGCTEIHLIEPGVKVNDHDNLLAQKQLDIPGRVFCISIGRRPGASRALHLEPCSGRAAPPLICGRRRRFLTIGAPPPIICRCAADAIFVCLIILLHFSSFA